MASKLDEIGKSIGALGEGTRGIEALKTPSGQKIMDGLKDLCNTGLKTFTQRYSRNIVDAQGRLDPLKFGRGGSMGNAMLIVVFTRLYTVIAELFRKAGVPPPIPPMAEGIATPAQKEVVKPSAPSEGVSTANTSKKIVKISSEEWNKNK
jgi:hypothetical protein